MAAAVLAALLAAGCQDPEDLALSAVDEPSEAVEPAPSTVATDEPAVDDGDDGQDEDGDVLAAISWELPPAGPGSPSVNEDPIYKILDDLDPTACRALLEPGSGWFDPTSFGTGERTVHLFRAGAHLCAGERDAGAAAYQQALGFDWDFAVEQPLHSRVCNVWDAVIRIVDPAGGPCVLEELTFDTSDATPSESPSGDPGDVGDAPSDGDAGLGGASEEGAAGGASAGS